MSLGRISGPLLQSNLQRQTDLAIETNLLYIGHSDGKIGIKTVTRPRDFTIDGTAKFRNATAGQPDLFINNSVVLGNLTLSTTGIDSLTGSINLQSGTDIVVGGLATNQIKIDGNVISTYNTNSDIDIRPDGIGTNEIVTAGKTVTVTGNTKATGNITFDGSVIIAGTGDEDNFTINADIVGNLVPDVTNTYDLGVTGKRMSLYAEEITTNSVFTENLIYQGIDLTKRVGNIYVATNGLDTNVGDTVQGAVRTLKKALTIATAGQVINIEPGEYEEQFPLQIPANVTIKGRDLRNCIIKPTTATNDKDCFLLDGETTVTDLTIKDFYYNSTDNTGYAFRFRSGAKVTSRSPYIMNITVITKGSVTSASDPRGFAQGDAGKGVYVDGEVCDHDTNEASMLFHAATFITPGVDALTMTNGVRVEWLNCFTYFANTGMYALNGPGRWRSDSVLIKGAEVRSIGSACVYGNIGAKADGANCLMYLIQHNMAYVGAGKEPTNDKTLINQANEIIELNSGNVYYQTVDQSGNFRVGDDFFIDFEKGTTSIDTSSIAGGLTSLKITTGTAETFLDGSKVQTGNIRVKSPNTVSSIDGDITFNSITGQHNLKTNVTAPSITTGGNVTLAGSLINFGNDPSDTIDFNTPFAQDIKPNQHMVYNLGSPTKRWLNSNLSQTLVDDFRIYDNVIEQTSTNANLELNPQGTGKVVFDNITASGDTLASTNATDLRLNANTSFTISANGSIELPTGSTVQRKNQVADLRYNLDIGEFEGNNGGTVYFPTMRDGDRDTYINLNDNQFRFVTANQQNTLLNQHILQTNKFTSDNKFSLDGNTITSATADADINLFANGTGGIPFEDVEFKGQTVTNKLNTPFTFGLADAYSYLKFDNVYGLVVPAGDNSNRPGTAEQGTTRWNQDQGYLETWNGTQWVLAAGGGASVTQEYAEDINFLWATLLG
tara:strand:+ start:2677 stop:5520 length:2844 start_codon:yes stop_codon:yes gene_type:complete